MFVKLAHNIPSQRPREDQMERHELTNTPQFGVAQKSATNLYLDARSNILLQTACAEVSNPNSTGSSLKTCIILDLGSQRRYVTHRLSEALQLQKIPSENLLVKTFGSSSEQFWVCDVVQVCLPPTWLIVPQVMKV